MANADMPETERNVDSLISEFRQLKTEFAGSRACSTRPPVPRVPRQRSVRARRGEQVWAKTESSADELADRIKEQPLASAGIAFGVGLLIGLILGRR